MLVRSSLPGLVVLISIGCVRAQDVPGTITYQGMVTDAAGQPLPDGSNAMEVRLYDAQTGGTQLWDSGAMNIGVRRGVFTIVLGATPTPPLSSGTLSSPDVWLEIKVGTYSAMPRTKLTSAPFALRAADLSLPFSKTVSTASPALEVTNTGANYAIKGQSSSVAFAGLAGVNTASGQGVYASTVSGNAVYGFNFQAGHVGILGGRDVGAFGSAGGRGYGVYGSNSGTGPGVYGENTGAGPAAWFAGRVGVGLPNPNRMLYVVDQKVGVSYPLKLDNPNSGMGTDAVGVLFSAGGDGGGNLNVDRGKGALVYRYADTWNRGSFHFLQETATDHWNPDLTDVVMTIANNGNVGIGSAEPSTKLDVQGLARVSGVGTPAGGKGLELAYDSEANRGYLRALDRDTSTPGRLSLGSGYVGLGTDNPQDRLHLFGQDAFLRLDGGATGFSGVKLNENGAPRWNIFFRQWQGDNLIFRDEPAANDTFVLEAASKTARVNGDLYVTGAVRGGLGPNGGAPFPRPAYDSGWVTLNKNESRTLTHNVGVDVNRYVIIMECRDSNGITNSRVGADVDEYLRYGIYYWGLTTTTVNLYRVDADMSQARLRIWLYN